METQVVHCRKAKYDCLIDRTTIWGNPFKIPRDGNREEVIIKYEKWIRSHPRLLKRLPELKGKILGCWCKPLTCHGDIIVKLINELKC
jgi:hypothetical protein